MKDKYQRGEKSRMEIEEKTIMVSKDDFLLAILFLIGINSDTKIKVFDYIYESITKNKILLESQREVSEKLKISYPIVSDVFVKLIKENILKKVSSSQYVLRVDIKKIQKIQRNEV